MEEVNVTPDPNDVQSNKVMAILAYFGILFLIPLGCKRVGLCTLSHQPRAYFVPVCIRVRYLGSHSEDWLAHHHRRIPCWIRIFHHRCHQRSWWEDETPAADWQLHADQVSSHPAKFV